MYPHKLRVLLKKKRSAKDLCNDAYAMFLYLCVCFFSSSDFLYKSICYGYSYELHPQVDAIQMGTHNICFIKSLLLQRPHAVWPYAAQAEGFGLCEQSLWYSS